MAEDKASARRRRSTSRSPNRHNRGRRDRSSSRERRYRDDDNHRRRDSKKRKHSRSSRSRSRGKHRSTAPRSSGDHDKDKHPSHSKDEADAAKIDVMSKQTVAEPAKALPEGAPASSVRPVDAKPKKTSRFSDKKDIGPSFENDELMNAPSVVASAAPKPTVSTLAAATAASQGTSASKESVKGTISDIFRIDNVVPSATNKSHSKPGSLSIVLGGPLQRRQSAAASKGPDTSSPLLSSKPPPPPPQQGTVVKPAPPPRPSGSIKPPPPPPLSNNVKPPPLVPSAAAPLSPRPLIAKPAPPAVSSPSKPPTAALATVASPPAPPVAIDVESMKNDILKALAAAKSLAATKKAPTPAAEVESDPQDDAPASHHEDDTTSVLELRKSTKPKASASSAEASATADKSEDAEIATSAVPESLNSTSPIEEHQGNQRPSSPPKPTAAAPAVRKDAGAAEFDMFALDEDDDDEEHDVASAHHHHDKAAARPAVLALERHGNHDDSEGYYKANIGEVMNGEYRVMGAVGKGVFSSVVLCKTLQDDTTVAVKLVRNNDTMRDAAQLEVRLLTELQTGPRRSKYIVRLLNSFEYRSHAAMVFEPMQMNVREAMKKFGGRDGLAIGGVKVFCRHLMLALDHLQTCSIVHADIKPDNMLLDDKQSMVKLCDFGSAFKVGAGEVHDPTPYLVSRYYRAPEVILGLPYEFAVDMWSLGCCLYEMFTGKVMFPGQTNNEMLKLFLELKGRFPTKLVRRHRQVYLDKFLMEPHFDDGLRFGSREIDRVTGTPVVRTLNATNNTRDLTAALLAAKSHSDDKKLVMDLKDLLDKIFVIDPAKRLTVADALQHPFVVR